MSVSTAARILPASIATIAMAAMAGFGPARAGEQTPASDAAAASEQEIAQLRKDIDADGKQAIDTLRATNDRAEALFDESAGYAVFRATKAGLLLTGAGGSGVAVNRDSGERTYMRMGSGGVGLGAGLQKYRLIILFQDQDRLARFVDGGWDAATSAQAAAGKAGVNATSSFVDGIAVFQLTDKGLMAQADLTGTRFWSSDKLNTL